MRGQLSLPCSCFLRMLTTLLCTMESRMPATVNTPPMIAQICTRKCRKFSRDWVYRTVTGERSYLAVEEVEEAT